ncbi:hypothetical protein V8E54_002144 [Elaphomyces granulatus]
MQVNSARDPNPEESILTRRGDQIATIPSLFSLWCSAVRTTGTFDASSRCYKVVNTFKTVLGLCQTSALGLRELKEDPWVVINETV